jgi:hypothetical protein
MIETTDYSDLLYHDEPIRKCDLYVQRAEAEVVPGDEKGLIQVVLDVHPHVLVGRHVQERARELVVYSNHLKTNKKIIYETDDHRILHLQNPHPFFLVGNMQGKNLVRDLRLDLQQK